MIEASTLASGHKALEQIKERACLQGFSCERTESDNYESGLLLDRVTKKSAERLELNYNFDFLTGEGNLELAEKVAKRIEKDPKYKDRHYSEVSLEDLYAASVSEIVNYYNGEVIKTMRETYPGFRLAVFDGHRHSGSSKPKATNLVKQTVPQVYEHLRQKSDFKTLLKLAKSPESRLSSGEILDLFGDFSEEVAGTRLDLLLVLTEHDNVNGPLKLRKKIEERFSGKEKLDLLSRTPLSFEATVRVPEMKINGKKVESTKVHVLVYGIKNEEEFREINGKKGNYFEFVKKARELDLPIFAAHPMLNVERFQSETLLAQALTLDGFELNAERLASDNRDLLYFLHNLNGENFEKISKLFQRELDTYFDGEAPAKYTKKLVAGRDDHAGLCKNFGMNLVAYDGEESGGFREALNGSRGQCVTLLNGGINSGNLGIFANSLAVAGQTLMKGRVFEAITKQIYHSVAEDKMRYWKKKKGQNEELYLRYLVKKIENEKKIEVKQPKKSKKDGSLYGDLEELSKKGLAKGESLRWLRKKGEFGYFLASLFEDEKVSSFTKFRKQNLDEVAIGIAFSAYMNRAFGEKYKRAKQAKVDYKNKKIDKNTYNQLAFGFLQELSIFMLKDVFTKIQSGDFSKSDFYYLALPVALDYFTLSTFESLCANRHVKKQLEARELLEAPRKKEKVGIFIVNPDKTHGVSKTVQSLVASEYRDFEVFVYCVVEGKKDFEKSEAARIFEENLVDENGRKNYKVYEAQNIIPGDFPVPLGVNTQLMQDIFDEDLSHLMNWTQDPNGFVVERFGDALQIPVVSVFNTDVGKFLAERTGLDFFDNSVNTAYKFLFTLGKSKVVCAPAEDTAKEKARGKEKILNAFGFGRFVEKHFKKLEEKPSEEFLGTKLKNGELGLENPFEICGGKESVKILFCGRLESEKRFFETFKFYFEQKVKENGLGEGWTFENFDFETLPIFYVIGGGKELEKITSYAKERKIPVALFGEVKDKELLNTLYNGADFQVFPSRSETFGRVTIEAGISGVPTILTNKGDSSKVILKNGGKSWETGVITGSDLEFFEAVEKLRKDKKLIEELSEKVEKFVAENYTEEAVLGELKEGLKVAKERNDEKLKRGENCASSTMETLGG